MYLQMNGINWDNNAASEVLGQGVGAQHTQNIPAHWEYLSPQKGDEGIRLQLEHSILSSLQPGGGVSSFPVARAQRAESTLLGVILGERAAWGWDAKLRAGMGRESMVLAAQLPPARKVWPPALGSPRCIAQAQCAQALLEKMCLSLPIKGPYVYTAWELELLMPMHLSVHKRRWLSSFYRSGIILLRPEKVPGEVWHLPPGSNQTKA